MLTYSMGVSADGFIADRDGNFDWARPSDERFEFHLQQVRGTGVHLLGRRLYETMLVWETDPSLPDNDAELAFAQVWTALPKVVFSRTLGETGLRGNARLATGSVADEIADALASTDREVAIGGATVAAQAIELGLVDEFRIIRCPAVAGGGTPYFPPLPRSVPLELVETRVFPERVGYERYRRA